MPERVAGSLEAGGHTISWDVPVPDERVPSRRLLPVLNAITDRIVAHAQADVGARGQAVSCGPGCSACCSYLVPVSSPEVRRLRELVEALPDPFRAIIRQRFAANVERLRAAGLLESLRDASRLPRRAAEALSDRYQAAQVPCPFLVEKRCGIYPDRPIACREHLVVSPAATCADTRGQPIRVVSIEPSLAEPVGRALAEDQDRPWLPISLALDGDLPEERLEEPAPALLRRTLDAIAAPGAPMPSVVLEGFLSARWRASADEAAFRRWVASRLAEVLPALGASIGVEDFVPGAITWDVVVDPVVAARAICVVIDRTTGRATFSRTHRAAGTGERVATVSPGRLAAIGALPPRR